MLQGSRLYYINVGYLLDHSKIQPSLRIANLGDTVNFTCESYGYTYWLVWDKSHDILKKLPRNARVKKNVLYIENINIKNQGIYECQGETEEEYLWSEQNVKFAARCTLAVSGKHKIVIIFLM